MSAIFIKKASLIALALAAGAAVFPSTAYAAGLVQVAAGTTPGDAGSFVLSFPANTSAGNLILVGFDFDSNATFSSLSDSQGNTFIEVGSQLTSPGGGRSRVYYAKSIIGGPETVTINLSASSSYIEAYLTEYTGLDPANPVDAQAGATGAAGAVSSGKATTTVAGDIIYGYCLADYSCTAGSGFVARSTLDHNLIEDQLAGSPGKYAATGSANNGWTMQMVALKPALAGAPPVITSATTASGTVNTAFSYQITATNTPTSYAATGLPTGLGVSSSSGLISGTPTAAGTSTVTLSATNSAGTGNATLTLTVTAVPVITSATTASGTANTAFSYQITATNTPTSYGATGLPAGLGVSSSSGLISGTPTAAGTSTVTLSATNSAGTGNATLTLTVTAVPGITSATAASGTVNTAFSYQITATNTPTSYGATGLPTGLGVSSSSGLISGTPTAAGTSTVTLSATNSAGTGNATLTLTVTAVPVITSATTASGTVNTVFSYQITATNTPTSYGATGLPTGLGVSSSSGLISGTPTAAGTSTVTLSATNSAGTGNATLTLTVTAVPVITSATAASGTVNTVFSYQITATNTPTSYGATGLPAGLGVSSSSGLISGTPTAAGTSTVTLSATNSAGTGNATLTLTVTAVPVITSATTASGTVNTAFSYQITATNTPTSYGATGLPAGLGVSSSLGLISGTPTAAGTSTVTLSATNSAGTGNATLTLMVTAVPAITSATTASGTVNTAFSYQITATNTPTSYAATGLPTGLGVSSSSGLISGTPTAAGTSTVMLSATNSAGTGNATLTLTVTAIPVITSATTASGTVNTAFSYQITATNIPTSYGATGLPTGLGVSSSSGLISGTTTAAGTSTVTLSATNSAGTGNATLTLTVTAVPGITSATTASGTVNTAFSYQITATNTPTSYGATGLPAGLGVSSSTGLISGTPTAAGTSTVTLSATNSAGTGNATLTLTVTAVPVITSATTASGTVNTAFSYQITATNTPTSYGATGLPTGLGVSSSSGLISGTPTAAGTSTVMLSATNSAGTGNATLTLTVTAIPVITSATTASGTVNTAFSYQITATNIPTSYGATGLPTGLGVSSSSGLISGTPTAAGTSTVTLSATNSAGTGNATLTLTVTAVPGITSATTASGTVNTAFSYQITATNTPTSYGATGLPAGLDVSSSTGLISGTPTAAGTSTVTLSATNSAGTGSATLTLTVSAASLSVSFVQSVAGTPPGSASSFSSSFPANTGAGNLILVGFDFDSNATFSSLSDSQGSTFTQVGSQLISPGGGRSRVYYAKNISGGADTVTVNLSGTSSYIELYLTEYTGADLANPIDVQAGASGNAGAVSSGNATTTVAGEIVYGYCLADGACNAGSGFAARSTLDHNLIEDTKAANPGSYAATGSANNGWTMQMVALKPGVVIAPPVITSATTASGTVNAAFSYQIAATNGPTSYGAAGLPAGLGINSSSGLISGTPTAAGTSTVTLSATNSAGTGTAMLTLTVIVVPVITSATTASGTVNTAFSYQITASNGPTSYGASGLPAGLGVSSSSGLISGTPTAAGTSTVTLSATNSGGTGTATLTLTVTAVPVITSVATAGGTVNTAFSYQITATNTPTSYGATGLPAGLGVSGGSGLISGTPTAAGTSTVTLSATNSAGTGNATLTLTVTAVPGITSATTASGMVNTAFSYQITATNTPTSYGATGLPAGLGVSSSSGLISGTPTAAGTSTVTLSATNSAGTGNATLTLTVTAVPVITSATSASGTVNTAFSYQITATNTPTSYGASGLPTGLSVSSSSGLISGTPTAAGTSTVTLSATNSAGTGNATLTLTVSAASLSVSFVQSVAGTPPGSASSFSSSFPANTSAGNLILVGFDFDSNATFSSLSDSQGNTFTQVGSQLVSPGGGRSRVYYAKNISGGADTVTVNLSGTSSYIELYLTEYTGADPANPIDVQAGASGNAGAVSSGNATTTVAGDIIYGYCLADGACNAGSGFAARSTLDHNLIEDTKAANPGSYAATGSANNGWTMQMVALKPGVVIAPPVITSATTASGTVNVAFSYQIAATNGPTSYGAAGLPAGLSVNSGSGLISGTPTAAGTSTVTLSATNGAGTGTATLVVTVTTPVGLVSAYAFNEGAGSTTADSSGNGITGSLVNSAWTGLGKYGNALSFNGASSYVDLGNPTLLQLTGNTTLEAWVLMTSVASSDAVIIGKSDVSPASGWQLQTSPDTGNVTFAVGVSPNGTSSVQRYSQTVPVINTWYHVAGVYNATAQTLDIYVNGVLDDGTLNGAIPASQFDSPVNVNIGRESSGGYFSGVIDEVRIYNRTLLPPEIQNDMNTPVNGGALPAVTLNPGSLSFPSQAQNTSSNSQAVSLTNSGAAPLSLSGISISSGGSNFTQTNNCGTSLALNATCVINVTFTPAASGQLTGTLTIGDNAPGNPHSVSLTGTGIAGTLTVSPRTATLTSTLTKLFTASLSPVTWSVDGVAGGSAASGTITGAGLYTPPVTAGTHTITAAVSSPPQSASATVYVSNYPGTFTYHNDNFQTGQNLNETVLTPANVNFNQFGEIFSYVLDGQTLASPLYVPNVAIPGMGQHNVVYAATEHDSVFALDADGLVSAPLWQASFINPSAGITTEPFADSEGANDHGDIEPEHGITGTPVIDQSTGTLYVAAKTKEVSGSVTNYVYRLHALDITTGAEKFGGPVVIQASGFVPLPENQRPGLILSNGVVYVGFASHGDVITPWHGWMFGYDSTTLQQVMAYNSTPNGSFGGGGIWQGGGGPAVDSSGNLFFATGNGDFDANTGGVDFGDSIVKLSTSGSVLDYFTPFDQSNMEANDLDLGSSGPVLLIDQTAGPYPHLLVSAGKTGTIYVVNRDNMGHYNASNNSQIVQWLPNALFTGGPGFNHGNYGAAVYFNGNIYYGSVYDSIRMFQLSNGLLSTSPVSLSPTTYQYPGGAMAISANATANGILWTVERDGPNNYTSTVPGILHAYDATNVSNELYNSNQATGSRDLVPTPAKFNPPLVANGRVYLASQNGQLTAYGLLP